MVQCMSKRFGVGLAAAGAVLLSVLYPTVICAQSSLRTRSAQVVDSITASQLRAVMENEGYAVELESENVVIWRIDGMRAMLLVADDEESVQFYAAFGDGNGTLRKANDWNKSKRYSRTYLDGDGDPCLELDPDLEGGVTAERIESFLTTCRVSFTAWCAEVVL